MGNKIVTEADRKFTPPLKPMPGVTLPTSGRGQRVSLERGVATRCYGAGPFFTGSTS